MIAYLVCINGADFYSSLEKARDDDDAAISILSSGLDSSGTGLSFVLS